MTASTRSQQHEMWGMKLCCCCGIPIVGTMPHEIGPPRNRAYCCDRCFTAQNLADGIQMDTQIELIEYDLANNPDALIRRYLVSDDVN